LRRRVGGARDYYPGEDRQVRWLMSDASDNDTMVAQRIGVLERGIDKSLMELTEVEVAINARPHPRPVEPGGLERRRVLLTDLITRMDAKLKQLRAHSPGAPKV
jgi:hypothetical protein